MPTCASWPKQVPICTASDLCTGAMQLVKYDIHKRAEVVQRCSIGHFNHAAYGQAYPPCPNYRSRVFVSFAKAYMTAFKKHRNLPGWSTQRPRVGALLLINDVLLTTDAERAAVLNDTWRRLGYDIPLKYCDPKHCL